jgi:hypothetical protein
MFLDRKPVPASLQGNTFVFRPSLDAENILAVGNHSVEVVLTDASGLQASASWIFPLARRKRPSLTEERHLMPLVAVPFRYEAFFRKRNWSAIWLLPFSRPKRENDFLATM